MRDPLSRGFYSPPRIENKLDKYIAQAEQRAAAGRKKTEDDFEDIDKLGGVWEKDVENLSNDFLKYRSKKVEFEKEKDPAKKALLYQEGVKLGAELETNIQKSKKQKAQYIAKAEQINRDKGFFFPMNATEMLNEWAGQSIYDRPDNIGIEMPSTNDYASKGAELFFKTIKDRDVRKVSRKSGDRVYTVIDKEFSEKDIDDALNVTVDNMPSNFVRSERARLLKEASGYDFDGNPVPPARMQEAIEATRNEENTRKYLKGLIASKTAPAWKVSVYEEKDAPTRGAGAGGAGGGKFSVKSSQRQFGNTVYTDVRATKIGAAQPVAEWTIPTQLLKDANEKYKLGIDAELKGITSADVSIQGAFVVASRNQNTGEYTVTINPKQFVDKYITVQGQITLPLGTENVSTVNAYLDGADVYDLIEQEEKNKKKPGTKQRTGPSQVGMKPANSSSGLEGFEEYKRR